MAQQKTNQNKDSLFTFPCRFPIKAIGKAKVDLSQRIFNIVEKHVVDLKQEDITFRHSKGKQYLSLTIIVMATSQLQLDAIYSELTADENILFVL